MYSKALVVFCIQLAIFQATFGQCINRIPNCGCPNILPTCGCSNILPVTETIIPNQLLINQLPNQIIYPGLNCETILPTQLALPTTTIIQDSTVANNLANTLQLLVVSNLLGNTLPLAECTSPVEVVSPVTVSPFGCGCGCGRAGFNVLY